MLICAGLRTDFLREIQSLVNSDSVLEEMKQTFETDLNKFDDAITVKCQKLQDMIGQLKDLRNEEQEFKTQVQIQMDSFHSQMRDLMKLPKRMGERTDEFETRMKEKVDELIEGFKDVEDEIKERIDYFERRANQQDILSNDLKTLITDVETQVNVLRRHMVALRSRVATLKAGQL